MNKSVQLVFFGSGPVGAATLSALIGNGFMIEAVVTKPKPAHHRGDFPVIKLAEQENIPLYTPSNKGQLLELFKSRTFKSSVGLVVDYGIIMPKKVIDSFKRGIINSHFSLLPQWRGADPITFAILSGQATTGVSLMLIDETLDTGPLLAQADYKIDTDETVVSLTTKLVELSNNVIKEVLPLYLDNKLVLAQQDPAVTPTYSRKLTKTDGVVNWAKPALELEKQVRAFLGFPKSRASINGIDVIITKARVVEGSSPTALTKKCGDGWLEIVELIAPSGRTMSGAAFKRGYIKN